MLHPVDDFDLDRFLSVASSFGTGQFGYVVTPNADHLIRLHEEPGFRRCYQHARFVLMDSRFCARLLWLLRGVRLHVCTGADLTRKLLTEIVSPQDRIVIIGAARQSILTMTAKLGLQNVRHFEPRMGFIRDPAAVEECLDFIEAASPFRFCFLAVGSPQQEQLAYQLQERRSARGLALCVGASLNFLVGVEHRAPSWMQRASLEWLYRLSHNPRRLARRYLLRGPRIFAYLLSARFVLRNGPAQGGVTEPSQ